jgi:NADP-dependent 3-hydroxy acid dehydrogenase YdfG
MSTDRDSGRVAVITGASSGIGEATARALAADGYRLALLARRADRIEALAGDLGDAAVAIEGDVTDRDSIVAAAERVERELGGADVLVNNAGVMLLAPFSSDQTAELRQMVETNLLGAMPDVRVIVIEPGAVATELTDHITNANAKQAAEQMYDELAITAGDIADVIAFALGRPRRMTLNEILIRPTAQEF